MIEPKEEILTIGRRFFEEDQDDVVPGDEIEFMGATWVIFDVSDPRHVKAYRKPIRREDDHG